MAEIVFSCPQCSQPMQCDDQWAGQQVACPSCQTAMIVPGAATQLRVQVKAAKKSGMSPQKIAGISAAVVVLAILGIFGPGWADKWQKHFNEEQKKEGPGTVAGEVGHIAALYDVLDKTDPEKMGRGQGMVGMITRPLNRRPAMKAEEMDDVVVQTPDPGEKLSVVPSAWTLDLAGATIPDGKINGMVGKSNVVIHTATLQPGAGLYTLSLQQGDKPNDPALFVYLPAKPGETLWGRSWKITRDSKVHGNPQVVKRFQPNPHMMAVRKPFNAGYAMQLELGTPTNGWVPGKIFLALPDAEKSFVAGQFYLTAMRPE